MGKEKGAVGMDLSDDLEDDMDNDFMDDDDSDDDDRNNGDDDDDKEEDNGEGGNNDEDGNAGKEKDDKKDDEDIVQENEVEKENQEEQAGKEIPKDIGVVEVIEKWSVEVTAPGIGKKKTLDTSSEDSSSHEASSEEHNYFETMARAGKEAILESVGEATMATTTGKQVVVGLVADSKKPRPVAYDMQKSGKKFVLSKRLQQGGYAGQQQHYNKTVCLSHSM